MNTAKYCGREWELLDEAAFCSLMDEGDECKDGLSGLEAFAALEVLGIVRELVAK